MKKTTKKTLAKASKKINTIEKVKENKKMKENFIIGSRDAKLVSGQLKEAKKAKPAVKAVEAVKAVKEVKAIPQKIVNDKVQPAVKAVAAVAAVKAIKAQPAVPATSAIYSMKIGCVSKPTATELIARMADQKIEQKVDTKITEDNGVFLVVFAAENQKIIRAAFKKCKSKDGYNASGLAILTAKAKKEAAKAAKEADKGKKEEKSAPESEGADWPTPDK